MMSWNTIGGINMKTGVVLVSHGSRLPSANEELWRVARLLNREGEYRVVQPAYLEWAEPDVAAGIDICVAKGADRVIVVPYFLLSGTHVRKDLAELAEEAKRRHPEVTVLLAKELGMHPVLTDIILDRIDAVRSDS